MAHRGSSKSSGDFVVRFAMLPPDSTHIAGGKGASLGRMTAAGFPVPPGFVVTASAFQVKSGEYLAPIGQTGVQVSLRQQAGRPRYGVEFLAEG